MFFDNVAHNEQAQPIAFTLCGTERLIHIAHHLVRDTGTVVADKHAHIIIIEIRLNINTAVFLSGNGLESIANQIIKHLKQLPGIRIQLRQFLCQ